MDPRPTLIALTLLASSSPATLAQTLTPLPPLPPPAAPTTKGPSSSAPPFVIGVAPGVKIISILTVGDYVPGLGGPYRMVGEPDGMGAFANADGAITLLVNHELKFDAGVIRRHGAQGAFVARYTINPKDLSVTAGEDLIAAAHAYDLASKQFVPASPAFENFCSATLGAPTAYFNPATGKGTRERIYTNGEETVGGRSLAHVVTGPDAGRSFILPWMGRMAVENFNPSPFPQDKTVSVLTDDVMEGQVYVWVGSKSDQGSTIERAGLTNGALFAIAVDGVRTESRATGIGAPSRRFTLAPLGDVRELNAPAFEALSDKSAATRFHRPEDGDWDPSNPGNYYFTTTDSYDLAKDNAGTDIGRTRLWRLKFDDILSPERGGEITMVRDGTGPEQMLDNIVITKSGFAILCEDTGNTPHNPKLWLLDLQSGAFTLLARLDPARFGDLDRPAAPGFIRNVESSGIIDAEDLLGQGWFLLNTMSGAASADSETVSGGQLLAMFVPQTIRTTAEVNK